MSMGIVMNELHLDFSNHFLHLMKFFERYMTKIHIQKNEYL